ncbi:hypothetical protein ACF08N_33280 [Streptomyces sp. NPDC015127]|uniref:hypothetical protein n=1 Tax=Streptomyces sp. NPDC015127 TaxID=3364939 RepID=UPI0036F9FF34
MPADTLRRSHGNFRPAVERPGQRTLITQLDPPTPGFPPVPEHRFVARSAEGDRTVLLSAPLEGVDPGRFVVEEQTARQLAGVLPVAGGVTGSAASEILGSISEGLVKDSSGEVINRNGKTNVADFCDGQGVAATASVWWSI